jgi:hypothetical protein
MPLNPSLEPLLGIHLWRGNKAAPVRSEPTGHVALDAVLPGGGWPEHALIELLLPADGLGELTLLLPTLARVTAAGREVALVGAPYVPYPPAWRQAGVDLRRLHVVEAREKQAAWAFEQVLRSASCAAVIAWPGNVDPAGLRRFQLAASEGRTLGFVVRDSRCAGNASPAALRLELPSYRQVLVRKCRGGMPALHPVAIAATH